MREGFLAPTFKPNGSESWGSRPIHTKRVRILSLQTNSKRSKTTTTHNGSKNDAILRQTDQDACGAKVLVYIEHLFNTNGTTLKNNAPEPRALFI